MVPSRSPGGSGPAPDESDVSPQDDDVVILEHSTLRHRLPNQHDLDSDDDQVIWSSGVAPWPDFDDLEDAILPHEASDDWRPAPGI